MTASDFFEGQTEDAKAQPTPQAAEQAQPSVSKAQSKSRAQIMEQAAIRRAVALEMIMAGKSLAEMTVALGYDRKSKTVQFLERAHIKIPRRVRNECKANRADAETENNSSDLTAEQLERAKMLGLTPGRFAYLLTCERGTSPLSHPLPGNAYTRNIL